MTVSDWAGAILLLATGFATNYALADDGAPVPSGGEILVDSDRGTIQLLLNGASVPTSVTQEADVTVYSFRGDLVIPSNTIIRGVGRKAVVFRATNNVFIGDKVTFDFSARDAQPGIGGGAGGFSSRVGSGGIPEPEYINTGGSPGGQGNQILCVFGICGEQRAATAADFGAPTIHGRGVISGVVSYDTDGQRGEAGGSGSAGAGASGGGTGGAGGLGGQGPVQIRHLLFGYGGEDLRALRDRITGDINGSRTFGGAAATARGTNGGQGQDALPFVYDWMHGADGLGGEDGGDGAGGFNTGTGAVLSGGGGGGAGGSGGGGSGGNSGQFGFPGSGGGGGMAFHDVFGTIEGGNGGAGKAGADGGSGTRGIDGGLGGNGGGGGGALEISAPGRIVIGTGSSLNADGGDGGAGEVVASSNTRNLAAPRDTVRNPGGAGTATLFGQSFGGAGGLGGPGGNGGAGGGGGTGGDGGGGAGGTVKLVGSVVQSAGADVSAVGGSGGGANGADGDDGRAVFAVNAGLGSAITVEGRTTVVSGPRGLNPFIRGGVETPMIPDLAGGAELFGMLSGINAQDPFFAPYLADMAADSEAALLRLSAGPGAMYAHSFPGFDWLFLLNLGDTAQTDPLLGVDPSATDPNWLVPLSAGGWTRDPAFGGGGDALLSELSPFDVYATLVPSDGTLFNVSLDGELTSLPLSLGDAVGLGATTPVPLPAGGWLLLSSLIGLSMPRLRLLRRESSTAN